MKCRLQSSDRFLDWRLRMMLYTRRDGTGYGDRLTCGFCRLQKVWSSSFEGMLWVKWCDWHTINPNHFGHPVRGCSGLPAPSYAPGQTQTYTQIGEKSPHWGTVYNGLIMEQQETHMPAALSYHRQKFGRNTTSTSTSTTNTNRGRGQ